MHAALRRGSVVALASMLGLSMLMTASPASPACEGFCAGAARADITPPVGTPMWGYSARAFYSDYERWAGQRVAWADTDLYAKVLFLRSEGVHTRLYARALVLRNVADVKMALVQTDLGAVTGEVHRAVANAVAPLGIARDLLLISATHTHGGPGTVQQPLAHGLLVGDHFDPRTFARLVDGIVRAITEADGRLAPARIAIGQTRLLDASVNRSMRAHAQGFAGHPNPCPDPHAIETDPCTHPGEAADDPHAIAPDMTMIRVDRSDGAPLGAWTNFAAHGTMFWSDDMRFSADNQGFAERMIEQGIAERARAAGTLPDRDWEIIAAYANSTEGDIAPRGSGPHRFAAAEDSGRRQARAALALWDSLGARMRDDLALDARWDWVYMNGEGGTSPLAILGAGPDCPFGTEPFPDDGIPGQGRKCPFLLLSGTGPNWFPLQVLRVGELAIGSIPGEMTVQMGRRVRARLNANAPLGTIPIIAGLANDYMAYITTPEEYDVQDYEGTFTLWGREQGPLIAARIGSLADRLFAGLPNPPFVEPPDTSSTQIENVSPVSQVVGTSGAGARATGAILSDVPAIVERGRVAQFAWVGGPPSVELAPDVPFVEVQRLDDDAWSTVFWDEGYETMLDYWREGAEDRWGIQWDVTMDAPLGTYRFRVSGMTWQETSGASARAYQVLSHEFDVVPSDELTIDHVEHGGDVTRVKVKFPWLVGSDHPNTGQPPPYVHLCSAARGTATCNYRWRAPGPTTPEARALFEVDGIATPAAGTYDPATDEYVFEGVAGGTVEVSWFTDGYGNRTS